jgi:DNA polymerase III delta prime subunit
MDFIEENRKPKKDHSLWVERYRPATMNDYIGNETVKEKFSQFIKKGDVPQILLFGPAGTGKTSLAKLLTKNIDCDVMYINASDENSVDDVRTKMKGFACSAGFKSLKVIILDEADRLSPEAQGALRNMTETYSGHTRFILTCNYVEKIIAPLSSRMQTFEIKPVSKKDVALKLVNILQTENVSFTQEDVIFMVNTYYPDIRKIINFAQQSSTEVVDSTGNVSLKIKISKENAVETDLLNKLVDLLKTPSQPGVFDEIRQLTTEFDVSSLETVIHHLFEKVDDYAKGKEALIIYELGELNWQMQLVIPKVRDITFLACIYKILKNLK